VSLKNPATITHVSVTSNVVTITTSANHGYAANDGLVVSAKTQTAVNGYFQVASTPSPTTFTYALATADIASVADQGVTIPDTGEVVARRDLVTIIGKTITQANKIKSGTFDEATVKTFFSDAGVTGFALIQPAKTGKWEGQKRIFPLEVTFDLFFNLTGDTTQNLYICENVWSKIRDDLANSSFWSWYKADEIEVDGPDFRTDKPDGVHNVYLWTFRITFLGAAGVA
jgi:hypothetical protein